MELPGPRIGPLSLNGLGVKYLLFIICVFAWGHAEASVPPFIRVLVEKSPSTAVISGFDLLVREAVSAVSVAKTSGPTRVVLECSQKSISLRAYEGRSPAITPPKVYSATSTVKVSSLGGFIRVGGRQLRDEVYVYSLNGECVVVNHVDLEKYVAGLLNSEMSASWNLETLKAQAIAARTYAIFQMSEAQKGGRPFDLESSVKDQVYEGAHRERHKALQAALQTSGRILVHNDKPIKAFYHSTCGGHTTSTDKVWGFKSDYITPVRCGFCHVSPRYRWSHRVTAATLEKAFKKRGLLNGRLGEIKVLRRASMGRVLEVEYLDNKKTRKLEGAKFREMVGYGELRSTGFDLSRVGSDYVFKGSGAGHGVGMCQWGAKTMGERGYDAAQILKKYYPLASITKFY